jgi:hypothetical protein
MEAASAFRPDHLGDLLSETPIANLRSWLWTKVMDALVLSGMHKPNDQSSEPEVLKAFFDAFTEIADAFETVIRHDTLSHSFLREVPDVLEDPVSRTVLAILLSGSTNAKNRPMFETIPESTVQGAMESAFGVEALRRAGVSFERRRGSRTRKVTSPK